MAVAMVLSDRTIRRLLGEGRIGIEPYEEELLQPSSVDVRVDRLFRVFRNSRYPFIDVKQEMEELTELVEIDSDDAFILHPGEFVLGSTLERITLPDDLVARLEGKSSLGRLGLLIHSTAGFIDPGWDGHVTLELSNVAKKLAEGHVNLRAMYVTGLVDDLVELAIVSDDPKKAKRLLA